MACLGAAWARECMALEGENKVNMKERPPLPPSPITPVPHYPITVINFAIECDCITLFWNLSCIEMVGIFTLCSSHCRIGIISISRMGYHLHFCRFS